MVLVVVRQEAGPVARWPKTIKVRDGKRLKAARGYNRKQAEGQLKQESTYSTLSQEMMKKRDE